MEDSKSSEGQEESAGGVFLSNAQDMYHDLQSIKSGEQSNKESSRQQGGEGVVTSASGGGQEGHAAEALQTREVQQYCECQQIYLEAKNSKKTLHVLAIAQYMDNDGAHLFSFDDKPWSTLPKTSMGLQNCEYLQEIPVCIEIYLEDL